MPICIILFQADVDAAVKAASSAFRRNSKWRTLDASARAYLMLKISELLKENSDYIAVSVLKSSNCIVLLRRVTFLFTVDQG